MIGPDGHLVRLICIFMPESRGSLVPGKGPTMFLGLFCGGCDGEFDAAFGLGEKKAEAA